MLKYHFHSISATPVRRLATTFSALLIFAMAWLSPAHAEYGFDPGYNENYVIDTFGSINGNAFREGRKLVTLPNGDIVVAGRMRLNNDTIQPYSNIGLVRYDRNGGRVTWPSTSGPYFWTSSQYVVYPNLPNGGSGDVTIEFVNDIAYADGKIYVLATRRFAGGSDRDVALFAFNEDGTFRQTLTVIGSAASEVGRAIDVNATNLLAKPVTVTILAERDPRRMVVAKAAEDSNGILSLDASFNGGAPLEVTVTAGCPGFAQCNLIPVDLARGSRSSGDDMPIYVTGAIQRSAIVTDWDFFAMQIDSSGVVDTSFGLGGLRVVAFDQPGSANGDYPSALWVENRSQFGSDDHLIIAGNINRSCKTGIGIARLKGNGDDEPGFGIDGRAAYGGSTEIGTICEQEPAHFANDITLQGNEIAVAGETQYPDQGGTILTDGALLRVDAISGEQRGLVALPQILQGNRAGTSRLFGISNAGGNRYSVSGEGNSIPYGLPTLYISARVWPSDTIFVDGFE